MIINKLIHGGDIYSENTSKVEKITDLSANINPLGMPDKVKQAITDNIHSYACYPDPLNRELTAQIATHTNTPANYILCSNGAADLIFRLVYTVKPKTALLISPTFAEYELALNNVKSLINYHTLKPDNNFTLDDTILAKINKTLDIMFVCNPNNPTGQPVKLDLMKRIAEKCNECGTVLIVDECFIDFLENEDEYSLKASLDNYNSLVILRAFTKMYAMAGIRLGYIISSNIKLLHLTLQAGAPWSVSTVASKCGIAALSCSDHVDKTKTYVKEVREFLTISLENFNITVFESKANFILIKTNFTELKDQLEEYGILIRSCSNYHSLDNTYFRIAVKTAEDCKYLVECLKLINHPTASHERNI